MATILCIDDDPRILDLYKIVLGTKGYTILTAPDGLTGIAMARLHSPDVLVLDFSMPGMDGNQVAQVLVKELPNLPVVVCSGFPEDIPASLKWFADSIIDKGCDPELLLLTIEKLIEAATAKKKPPARTTLDRQEWLRIRREAL